MVMLDADSVAGFRPLSDIVPEHWRRATTAAPDGTTLHWTDTGGNGSEIVVIHGIQVDGMTWLRTARALEADHRVVMPDLRGHGRSGRVRAPVTLRTLADDVATVLDAAGVARPILVGHSLGADVAGLLASRRAVRGVVLVDPVLRPVPQAGSDAADPPPWMTAILDTLHALASQPHAERMVTGLRMLPPGSDVDWDEADYVSYVEGQARFDTDVYRHLDVSAPLVSSPDLIAAIGCPVLLLTARPMLPGANIDDDVAPFTAHWRDGRHVHVADAGHAIPADAFDRFIDEVTAFTERGAAD